ncbi:MAG TPA: GNAT family N-acetyltransferase [Victivallales bacterium]|nr:GNAT family N-acetyltransferase [Victivallales bacterium]
MTMKYKTRKASNLKWLDTFYKNCGYGGKFTPSDIVVYAVDNETPIGVGRLSLENEVFILRGMQILQKYQGKGIGTTLLNKLIEALPDRECFCLPYTHLLDFYRKVGFRKCNINEVPRFLKTRLQSYRANKIDVQLLVLR